MKDLQTARKRLFLAVFLLLLALVCAAVGIAMAKYVREEKSDSLTVTVEYKENYLVPYLNMSTGLESSPKKIVFTTLDDLSAKHNVTYYSLTNLKDMGYEVKSDGTGTSSKNVIDTIKFGYDASTETGYFISMTNRPIVPYSCNSLFYGNYQNTTAIDFGGTVTVSGVEVPLFDTSSETNMHSMFHGCSSLTSLDLSKFDTSKVRDMLSMFNSCSSLASLDLSTFDTSNVTTMESMFFKCYALSTLDLSKFDTSNVKSMASMFNNCSSLTSLDVSSFDTSNVTDMSYMFCHAEQLTSLDLSSFNTSNVTTMVGMFEVCSHLTTLDVTNFNTEEVTSMMAMFRGCSALTGELDVSSFRTPKVESMQNMFSELNVTAIKGLENFNTSQLTNMTYMFQFCANITELNLSSFNVSQVTLTENMFNQCTKLRRIFANKQWELPSSVNGEHMFMNCNQLVGGAGTVFDSQFVDTTRAHIDGGTENPGYLTDADMMDTAFVHDLLEQNSATVKHVVFGSTANRTEIMAGSEAIPVSFASSAVNCYLSGDTAYFLSDNPILVYYDASNLFKELTTIETITFESSEGTAWFDTSLVTNMSGMFEAKEDGDTFTSALATITGLETFDTSNVTTMKSMFRHCEKLTGTLDLSAWDTSNVTTMEAMFDGLHVISEIKFGTGFDTSKVTSMRHMFNECENLSTTLDLSMFDTSNVTDMFAMFNRCKLLPSITFGNNFNTKNVTTMAFMFAANAALTSLDLSKFNTAEVTSMYHMFSGCETITELDLSSFDTAKVTDMGYMFTYCYNLITITVAEGSWIVGENTNTPGMFDGCISLVGGSGTTYDEDHMDGEYARVDGAMQNGWEDAALLEDFKYCGTPGYLTAKNAMLYGVALNAILRTTIENYPAVTNLVIGSLNGYNEEVKEADVVADGGDGVKLYISGDTAYLLSENRIKANPNLANLFTGLTQITKITFEKYGETELWFDTSEVVSMFGMFSGLTELRQVENLSLLNTSKVQNMHDIFYNCGSLANISDVKSWDVSNVVSMISMFCWNDDDWFNVKRTSAWTTIDLSDWDVANVRSIYHMFAGCYTVTEINLTWQNTQNLTNMASLFYECKALTTIIGLDSLDTSNVTNMQQTFDLCSVLMTLDLSTWNTQKVTNMQFMFSNCNVLEIIYVGDGWSTDNVTSSKGMFGWCLKLNDNCSEENSDLNDADNDYVDKTHAHTGSDGYLTSKS